jgi:hypothetical protein
MTISIAVEKTSLKYMIDYFMLSIDGEVEDPKRNNDYSFHIRHITISI